MVHPQVVDVEKQLPGMEGGWKYTEYAVVYSWQRVVL